MKEKISTGRKAVDAYRAVHTQLYAGGWHKGIPEEHTPLLEKLVADLEKQGFTSAYVDFETKKTEVLAKIWAASDDLNAQEKGYEDRNDPAIKPEDLEGMWQ